jgi:serine phosphatase RsbU (regulator of sigma subunit)
VAKVLQQALDRLTLLADAASALASTLDVEEGLRRVCHLDLAARYAPYRATAEVGGDWYDGFLLPQGDTSLIIGDVT